MSARLSNSRSLWLSLAALALVGSTAGCQIRIGNPAGGAQDHREADDCLRRGQGVDACRASNAEYDAARADMAEKQRQFDATFSEDIAAFHAIEADLKRDDAAPATATRAEELRSRFLKRCIDESGWSTIACWQGTFVRDITLALAKIRFRQGDLLAAAVEAWTIEDQRDLRPEDEKIWRAHALSCARGDMFAGRRCSTFQDDYEAARHPVAPALSPELHRLTSTTTQHDTPVDWQGDVVAVTKTAKSATVSFRPWQTGASEGRSCGDAEWRTDRAGNQVLVRPCTKEHYAAQYQAYAPAIVPLSEIGDFKLTKDTSMLVAYLPKAKGMGHVVETSAFTGETNDRGLRKFRRVLFRGLPVKDAKPGYP